MTTTCPPAATGPLRSPAGAQVKKEKLPRELDPRNPNFRLQALLDDG